jgi:hypothetical protein
MRKGKRGHVAEGPPVDDPTATTSYSSSAYISASMEATVPVNMRQYGARRITERAYAPRNCPRSVRKG